MHRSNHSKHDFTQEFLNFTQIENTDVYHALSKPQASYLSEQLQKHRRYQNLIVKHNNSMMSFILAKAEMALLLKRDGDPEELYKDLNMLNKKIEKILKNGKKLGDEILTIEREVAVEIKLTY